MRQEKGLYSDLASEGSPQESGSSPSPCEVVWAPGHVLGGVNQGVLPGGGEECHQPHLLSAFNSG